MIAGRPGGERGTATGAVDRSSKGTAAMTSAAVTPGDGPTDHFDVVVVGSGFGGSVSAYRLAAGGLSVCVLERGHPWPPNSFPRDPTRLARNLWDPDHGLYGMFDVWSFRGLEGVVSSGLGGGSLIYANVLIRKDERWFVKEDSKQPGYEYWPLTRADLDPHYDAVEKMLNAQSYPFDLAPYSATTKTQAMKQAASALGLEWQLPRLAVTFANKDRPPALGECIEGEPPNLHGATRVTCRLCGECDIGCNFGAKNTLDYNYLSRAKDQGAVIRTLSEVKRIDSDPRGGYVVTYVQHDSTGSPGRSPSSAAIHADKLILAAGTFGSPYLLLRNRAAFPALSPALGTHFSGNGDLLTFIDQARGPDGQPRSLDPSIGPVITSAIRVADELDGTGVHGRGFYVEDGGNPAFLDYLEGLSSAPFAELSSGLIRPAARVGACHRKPQVELFGPGEPGVRRREAVVISPTASDHGTGRPGRCHVVARRRPRAELDDAQVGRLFRSCTDNAGEDCPRPGWPLPEHPALAVQAGDNRPPSRWLPHGPRTGPRAWSIPSERSLDTPGYTSPTDR